MVNDALLSYVRKARTQGYSDTAILEVLSKNGWKSEDVSEALRLASAPSAPLNPAAVGYTPPQVQTLSQEESITSPYAAGLSIVLAVSLFILVQKIFSDVKDLSPSINSGLVFNTLFIVPFLVTAFMLHSSFAGEGKKFTILSNIYFVISGWLLLRLLLEVSRYILDKNNVYGVYFVLLIVIATLTGIIFFVQKYIKK